MLLLLAGYGLAAVVFYGYIYLTARPDPYQASLPESPDFPEAEPLPEPTPVSETVSHRLAIR